MVKLPSDGAGCGQGSATQAKQEISLEMGHYAVRLAETDEDRATLYRLRFVVFNLEMSEGLDNAFQTGEDRDEFDACCDHLMVEDLRDGQVVGTYRLQSGPMAAQNLGYYSAQEFDFSPYENVRGQLLELGRACVHREHRSMEVLTLLWRGIAQYALHRDLRYLIGCSSLNTQDTTLGAAMYRSLRRALVEPSLRTLPLTACAFPLVENFGPAPKPPKLLQAYLAVGAKICGPPAIDRQFGTIDFLTLLDLQGLSPVVRTRFLREEPS